MRIEFGVPAWAMYALCRRSDSALVRDCLLAWTGQDIGALSSMIGAAAVELSRDRDPAPLDLYERHSGGWRWIASVPLDVVRAHWPTTG